AANIDQETASHNNHVGQNARLPVTKKVKQEEGPTMPSYNGSLVPDVLILLAKWRADGAVIFHPNHLIRTADLTNELGQFLEHETIESIIKFVDQSVEALKTRPSDGVAAFALDSFVTSKWLAASY